MQINLKLKHKLEHPKRGEGPKMPSKQSCNWVFRLHAFAGRIFHESITASKPHKSGSPSEMPHLKQVIWQQWKGKTGMCWLKALGFELAHQPSWQTTLLSAFRADLSWHRHNSGTTSVSLVSEWDLTFVLF